MTTGLRKQSKSFPANLLAGMYGFKDGVFFDASKEAKAAVKVKF